jgi:hypothetical protein
MEIPFMVSMHSVFCPHWWQLTTAATNRWQLAVLFDSVGVNCYWNWVPHDSCIVLSHVSWTWSVGRSFKLLLAFINAGFSIFKIHDLDFYYILEMHMFQNGASSLMKEGLVFLCRCCLCCTIVSARELCNHIVIWIVKTAPFPTVLLLPDWYHLPQECVYWATA